jgi:hypothetical protein
VKPPIDEDDNAGLWRTLRPSISNRNGKHIMTAKQDKSARATESKETMKCLYDKGGDGSALKAAQKANTRPMVAYGQHVNRSSDRGRRK